MVYPNVIFNAVSRVGIHGGRPPIGTVVCVVDNGGLGMVITTGTAGTA